MVIDYIALVVALLISCVSGYFSVVGLTAVYAGSALMILIMGASIEVGKVVTASVLYRRRKDLPWTIKWPLAAVFCGLMFVTSVGVFGFLSKAHIDQAATSSTPTLQINVLENQKTSEQRQLDNAQRALGQLDKIVDEANTRDVVYIRNRQKTERANLNQSIEEAEQKLQQIDQQLLPLQQQSSKAEADVGPLKYVASMVYGDKADSHMDQAVRGLSTVIVVVLDPLAILLLLAANVGLAKQREEKQNPDWVSNLKKPQRKRMLEVDPSSVMTL